MWNEKQGGRKKKLGLRGQLMVLKENMQAKVDKIGELRDGLRDDVQKYEDILETLDQAQLSFDVGMQHIELGIDEMSQLL